MNSEVEPPQKKKMKTNPCPSSFSSLPDVIVANCLARISKSYYPKLSLVSKTFRSFVLSKELGVARCHHETMEEFFHVCLQFPDRPSPSWYSLWIKPDQTLTNEISKKKKKRSTGNTLLVQIPSSYTRLNPMFILTVGSENYGINQNHHSSCNILWVNNKKEHYFWRVASRMTVARANAVMSYFDEKIYVMGGCGPEETKNWGEVFDTKTRTWEPLPDPGVELRFSKIRTIQVSGEKLYVRINENPKDYVYDPKEGKWDVVAKGYIKCVIENVTYGCGKYSCFWYDKKRKEWREVRGLVALNRNPRCGLIEIVDYRGKLLVLWDKFVYPGREKKDIWCAVIALERRNNGDEVWGNIEWANVVLTVPSSYRFLRSRVTFR